MKIAALILFCAFFILPPSSLEARQKPNFLVVLTDDQRFDEMRFLPKTNRLLKKDSLDLKRFFAPFPLCCPARMSIYTGQSAHNHGVDGNFPPEAYYGLQRKELENTLPRWLQRAGYRTGHVGKFLNGYGVLRPREIPPGWNSWHGTIDQTSYDYYNYWINDNGSISKYGDSDWNSRVVELSRRIAEEEFRDYNHLRFAIFQLLMKSNIDNTDFGADSGPYITDELGKRAKAFLRQKSTKPFYLEFAPTAPHREDLPENAGYRGINPRFPDRYLPRVQSYSWENSPSYDKRGELSLLATLPPLAEQTMPLGGQTMEEMIAYYRSGRAGSLLALDDQVSEMIRLLKRMGQWNNTIFIFTSDNGWLIGEHRVAGDKYLPYEESVRVPFLIRGPGIKRGKSYRLAQNTDITKTIIGASGARAGRRQEGVDLRRISRDQPRRGILLEATRPLFLLPEFPYPWDVPYYGIRTDKWKYIRWSYDEEELYNLKTDPYEINNLADRSSYSSVKKTLGERAKRLRFCKGPACIER